MTMHSAKGLEFPIVFIMGMEESLFPHIRAIKSEDDHVKRKKNVVFVMNKLQGLKRCYHHATSRMLFGRPSMHKYAIQILKGI